jgi:hypothetical protein
MHRARFQGLAPGRQRLTDPVSTAPPSAPGKRTLTEAVAADHAAAGAPLQMRSGAPGVGQSGEQASAQVHAAATRGTATPASKLPHADHIQRAFGRHDISRIQAHVGGDAAASAQEMGAQAYATGDHVVLGDGADLHTVAHEAAHVIQQRGGVHLRGGVGEVGDSYEQHADAVADRVVRGESSEALLDAVAPSRGGGVPAADSPVQRLRLHNDAVDQSKDGADSVVTWLRQNLADRLARIQAYYDLTEAKLDKRIRALVGHPDHTNDDVDADNFEAILRQYLDQYYHLNARTVSVTNTRVRENGAAIGDEMRQGAQTPHAVFTSRWNGGATENLEADGLFTDDAQVQELPAAVHAMVKTILRAWPGNRSPFEYLLQELADYGGGARTSATNVGDLVGAQASISYRFGGGKLVSTPAGRRLIENLIQHIVKLRARTTAELDLNVNQAQLAGGNVALNWNNIIGFIHAALAAKIQANQLAAPTPYDEEDRTMHELLTLLQAADAATWNQLTQVHPQSGLRRLRPANQWLNNPARSNVATALGHMRRFAWETQLMLDRLLQGSY